MAAKSPPQTRPTKQEIEITRNTFSGDQDPDFCAELFRKRADTFGTMVKEPMEATSMPNANSPLSLLAETCEDYDFNLTEVDNDSEMD